MKQSLAKDAVKLTTSKVVTLIISMFVAMILSRFRTLEEYGTYSQLLLVMNLATTIFMIGLPNCINYFLAKADNEYERNKFLSVYYSLSTLLSMVSGFILVLSVPIITDYFDNPLIKNFVYVLAVYPWTKIILSSIENILIVYHKTSSLVLFRIMHSLSMLLTVAIVEIFNFGFSTYMLFFIIEESFFCILVYIIVSNLTGLIKISFDFRIIANILKFSIPIGLASMVSTLNIELDKLLIGSFFTTEKLAIYTNAAREMPVTIISSSLTAVLMPQLVKLLKQKKTDSAISLWGEATLLSYIFICFIATALFVFAPEVILVLYSEKYLPGTSVFRVYNIVLLLRCTYFGIILNSVGKTKFILVSSLASLGLNVILNYLFYYIFGYIGPAIATLAAVLLIQLLQLFITSKVIDIKFTKIFPWRNLLIISIINLILGLTFYGFKIILPLDIAINEIVESVIIGLIWGIIYLLIMKKFIKKIWKNLNNQ